MLADDVAAFIAAATSTMGSGWVVGTNVFIGSLPETPDKCLAIIEYSGRAPAQVMGGRVAYEIPRIQVICRSHGRSSGTQGGRAEALDTANRVLKTLIAVRNQTLTSTRYLAINPTTSPFFLDRDANDRPVVACNYEVMKELS